MTVLGKIQQVSIEYGDQSIIQHVSLDITKGSCVGIVGRNGEGKSTLLSLLASELEASEGSIQWIGGSPTIYYCKQNELMDEAIDNKQDEDHVSHKWHVPKNRAYSVMSGGEKMKKRLSQAFSSHVHLLLLDEPTITEIF